MHAEKGPDGIEFVSVTPSRPALTYRSQKSKRWIVGSGQKASQTDVVSCKPKFEGVEYCNSEKGLESTIRDHGKCRGRERRIMKMERIA